jgi:hypothetical protein
VEGAFSNGRNGEQNARGDLGGIHGGGDRDNLGSGNSSSDSTSSNSDDGHVDPHADGNTENPTATVADNSTQEEVVEEDPRGDIVEEEPKPWETATKPTCGEFEFAGWEGNDKGWVCQEDVNAKKAAEEKAAADLKSQYDSQAACLSAESKKTSYQKASEKCGSSQEGWGGKKTKAEIAAESQTFDQCRDNGGGSSCGTAMDWLSGGKHECGYNKECPKDGSKDTSGFGGHPNEVCAANPYKCLIRKMAKDRFVKVDRCESGYSEAHLPYQGGIRTCYRKSSQNIYEPSSDKFLPWKSRTYCPSGKKKVSKKWPAVPRNGDFVCE